MSLVLWWTRIPQDETELCKLGTSEANKSVRNYFFFATELQWEKN